MLYTSDQNKLIVEPDFKKMVFVIILLSINLLLHYFQNQILWVFFWRLSALFGCRENERKFEENQMKCEKGTNLFVWFKTRVFALSSLFKGGFWLRFLRKKAHKWWVFLVFSFLLCGFGFYPTRHGRSRFKKVYCNRVFFGAR